MGQGLLALVLYRQHSKWHFFPIMVRATKPFVHFRLYICNIETVSIPTGLVIIPGIGIARRFCGRCHNKAVNGEKRV